MKAEATDLVVKSNKLIEASYRLDLIEQRIVLAAIVEARETGKGLNDGFLTLNSRKFGEMFGMNPETVYSQLKAGIEKLYERSILFYDIDPETGSERVISSRWIGNKAVVSRPGVVQLHFNPMIVPLITRLEEKFTSYRLERIGRMTSQHAIRLYELLLQYEKIGFRVFPMEEFRRTLQLTDMYSKLSALKRYVIEPAEKQINELTDLTVEWSERKTGRQVTHLVFTVKMKNILPIEQPSSPSKKEPEKDDAPRPIIKSELSRLAFPGESEKDALRRLNAYLKDE
ncbi:RepB family plasmid replication initiator protein [Pseudomonas asuensis]|uniref:Initiator Rep protein WH1 domain-containing protein n=1 Tax=Pseudomonas asuensis TaxID=1825787 RepID=A0ABQ2H331_9PSED|nr:RepB family plasmid replication initiator protein [Pseudomonas asuensis]GGM26004.1 hypothetical protein GCM10009425_40960 [Pseudomonas asuensis]